jgi:hypothetical protein
MSSLTPSVAKLDEPPNQENFLTSPGSDISDVEESYHRKRIWQWQFCTGSQRIILSRLEDEDGIEFMLYRALWYFAI